MPANVSVSDDADADDGAVNVVGAVGHDVHGDDQMMPMLRQQWSIASLLAPILYSVVATTNVMSCLLSETNDAAKIDAPC